ncbi:hypothetical protein GCM10010470_02910 [Saccharopolyspora taberi]|uniref:Uncharacterized protein n=1 Tax=Saccharopolyspora taberi TaxID=60895 RepID=A0ABN3V265_9PSEU
MVRTVRAGDRAAGRPPHPRSGEIFPGAWAEFRTGVPEADRDGDLADAYAGHHADGALGEAITAATDLG